MNKFTQLTIRLNFKTPREKNTLSDIFKSHRVKNLRTFESQQLAPSKLQVEM